MCLLLATSGNTCPSFGHAERTKPYAEEEERSPVRELFFTGLATAGFGLDLLP
jgi:hypothetical protein